MGSYLEWAKAILCAVNVVILSGDILGVNLVSSLAGFQVLFFSARRESLGAKTLFFHLIFFCTWEMRLVV